MLPPVSELKEETQAALSTELLPRAVVIDAAKDVSIDDLLHDVAQTLGRRLPMPAERLHADLMEAMSTARPSLAPESMVLHLSLNAVPSPVLVLIRSREGLAVRVNGAKEGAPVHALIVMVTAKGEAGIASSPLLALIMGAVRRQAFRRHWLDAESDEQLRAALALPPFVEPEATHR